MCDHFGTLKIWMKNRSDENFFHWSRHVHRQWIAPWAIATQHTYIQSMLNLARFISFLLYKSLVKRIKLYECNSFICHLIFDNKTIHCTIYLYIYYFPFLEPKMTTEGGSISILTQILEYTSDRKYLKLAWRFVSGLLM